jgi:protein-tyrosine phosphatase
MQYLYFVKKQNLGIFLMETPYRVLCVCLGNICRSPTAEAILRHYCDAHGLNVVVDSAGTSNYHPNKAPDARSQKHATTWL